jgi:RHS repeat-associated protein
VVFATLLILGGLSAPQSLSNGLGSIAEAAGTGTGGRFVPVQGRLMDTRSGTGGYNTPFAANELRSLQVTGQANLPSSGVNSVLINVTVIDTPGQGVINVEPNGAAAGGGVGFLVHNGNETVSNTGVVEVAADGKIQIRSQWSLHMLVDVQGYFQTGDGTAAPGGFVPLQQQTLAQQAGVAPGTYMTNQPAGVDNIQVTGLAGVPTTATAIFANITVVNNQPGAVNSQITAFPTATTMPGTSLNYAVGTTSIGAAIDLNAQGKLSIYVQNPVGAKNVDIFLDVFGYFDGEPSNASYNTLQTRLYDSRTSSPLQPGEARAITVGGVGSNGTMPTTTASLAGFAMNITASSGAGGSGYMTFWGADDSEPAVSSIAYEPGYSSNLIVIKPGTAGSQAPNVVYVRNNGGDPVDVIVDAEGWFTNANVLPAAVGGAPGTSGNRASNSVLMRNLTDRVQAGVNPTNGNLLVTQSLLSLAGVGPSASVGIRYNAINDVRPTLNVGLFEGQLFRNPDQSFTYTDPTGAAFRYTAKADQAGANYGTYNMPNDINAHLKRTVDGSPIPTISAGATYELVFHPSQIKNVYVSDGANLKLVRTEDVTGANKITYTYGTGLDGGKLTSMTDTQGRVINFGYSNTPNPTQPTTVTDTSIGRSITLAYAGPNGALSQVTDALGNNTIWSYNSNGKLSSVRNFGTGSRTDFTYGAGNKTATVTYGANDLAVAGKWTFAYDPTAKVTTVTDPLSTTAVPRTNKYNFNNPENRVTSVTDARGLVGSTAFEVHGEVSGRTAAGLAETTYTYTPVSGGNSTYNLEQVKTGGGSMTDFTYPTAVGNGATADYRPQSVKDAQGNYSTMTYNSWGQALTVAVGKANSGTATPLGGTITYTYHGSGGVTCGGKNGQLCSKTDGKGNVTSYTYNTAGNLTTINLPTGLGDRTFTYDAAGRQITQVDGRGNTRYTCYDKNDRILQISYTSSNCATPSGVTYTYDTAGNTTSRTDGSGTTNWTYDAQMRATVKDHTGTLNDSTATYDKVGNVLTVTDGSNSPDTTNLSTTTYSYDKANNLVALAEPGGSCPATPTVPNTTKCTVFTMWSDKDLRQLTQFPSGVKTETNYDTSGRMTTLTTRNATGTTTMVNQAYTWITGTSTDTQLLQKITDNVVPSNTTTYGYDDLNRLTNATRSGASWNWTYDRNGNRTQQNASGTITNYGYNAADQMCWSATGTSSTCTAPAGATTYSYDGNGNQTTGGSTYSNYDQLASTTTGASQTYTYSGTSNNTRITRNGSYFNNNLFNQVTGETSNGGTKYVREPDGTPVAIQNGGNSYYYTVDYNNSVILLTNSTQAAVATYKYDPFGKATVTNIGTNTIGTLNPLRYATGYQDPNTGLIKLGARYYNADQGRFTQPDPSGQESNNYLYAAANPASYSDPTGLFVSVPADYVYNPGAGTLNDYCSYSSDYYGGFSGNADFTGPCARHDQCYGNAPDGSLYNCDVQLGSDLRENCSDSFAWYEPDLAACYVTAASYQAAVTVAW